LYGEEVQLAAIVVASVAGGVVLVATQSLLAGLLAAAVPLAVLLAWDRLLRR
jgi:hypothetical protein